MAITKQAVTILVPTSVVAGTTAAAPVVGPTADVRGFAGGEWAYKITNDASAPTVACTIVLQTSPDGTNWFDYFTVGGSTVPGGNVSSSLPMGRGVMFARVIAYGNVTNGVIVESRLQAVVG